MLKCDHAASIFYLSFQMRVRKLVNLGMKFWYNERKGWDEGNQYGRDDFIPLKD